MVSKAQCKIWMANVERIQKKFFFDSMVEEETLGHFQPHREADVSSLLPDQGAYRYIFLRYFHLPNDKQKQFLAFLDCFADVDNYLVEPREEEWLLSYLSSANRNLFGCVKLSSYYIRVNFFNH